jgi:O-antigen ligase
MGYQGTNNGHKSNIRGLTLVRENTVQTPIGVHPMPIKPRVDARAALTPPPQVKSPYPPTTVLGLAVAVALPFNSELPSAPRALWFACIVALIGVPLLFLRTGRRPLYPAIWAFAGYASLIALLTATKEATVEENLFVGAQFVLLLGFGAFAMTANAVNDPKFVQRVSIAFLVGQFLSAMAAISQLLGQPVLGSQPLQGRAYGLAEHPNTLGFMSCLAILIAVQFLLASQRFRLLVFAALSANIISLIASGSVGSMLALLFGISVLIVSMRDHFGKIAIGAIACTAALWVIGRLSGVFAYLPSVMERYGQVTGQTESVSSWELRTLTYDFAWRRIVEEPIFGVGLGAKFSGTYNGVTVTHNIFLRAWYQGGILLGIAVGLIVIAVLIVALRAMIEKTHIGEASVLVAILAFALTSAMFEQRHYWLPVLVAWGSLSAAASKQRDPVEAAPQLSPETSMPSDLTAIARRSPLGSRVRRARWES